MQQPPRHPHLFGQEARRPGERRTILVVVITAIMMVVEIAGGIVFGSMALLADGLHMASHMVALLLSVIAYVVARRQAANPAFSFGTGKVNVLAGYTGAILLALFALAMVWESVERLLAPQVIAYDQAILVAVIGLVVNAVSAVLLGHHGHDHGHQHAAHESSRADHHHAHGHHHHDHDHNLRSAYLHVIADALTSLLAIAALVIARFTAADWIDPVIGLLGAALVARWSWGLLTTTGGILLDRQADPDLVAAVRTRWQEEAGVMVEDLHIWSIGPGIYNLSAVVAAPGGQDADSLRAGLPEQIVHATIELGSSEPAGGEAKPEDPVAGPQTDSPRR